MLHPTQRPSTFSIVSYCGVDLCSFSVIVKVAGLMATESGKLKKLHCYEQRQSDVTATFLIMAYRLKSGFTGIDDY